MTLAIFECGGACTKPHKALPLAQNYISGATASRFITVSHIQTAGILTDSSKVFHSHFVNVEIWFEPREGLLKVPHSPSRQYWLLS